MVIRKRAESDVSGMPGPRATAPGRFGRLWVTAERGVLWTARVGSAGTQQLALAVTHSALAIRHKTFKVLRKRNNKREREGRGGDREGKEICL